MTKEIAKKGVLATTDRPNWMKQESTRGSEEVTNKDIALPRIQIIQDLSPQHKKNKEEHIEGAEVGDAFNTVSQQLYKESLLFIPVYFKVEYIIWKSQDSGGGFHGAFESELAAKRAVPEAVKEGGGTKDMYEVVETNVHFVMILDEEKSTPEVPVVEQAVISMSKSQNKVSRNLNSIIRMAGGDRFSKIYRLRTVDDKNPVGQEYKNWGIKQYGWVSEALYALGEFNYDAVKSGERKVDYGSDAASAKQTSAKADTPQDSDVEDEFAV
jgi:hypothetical protein